MKSKGKKATDERKYEILTRKMVYIVDSHFLQ